MAADASYSAIRAVGRFYRHDSPYTYFTSKELHLQSGEQLGEPIPLAGRPVHLGEISLECSRAGAAAVALWATQRLLPLTPGGEFAHGLERGRAAALELDRRLRADARGDARFEPLAAGAPELDIVVWALHSADLPKASVAAQRVFDACAARDLHLALVQLPAFLVFTGRRSGTRAGVK